MRQQEEQHSLSLDAAEEVRDFYERYPYPRPVDSLEKYRLRWQDLQRRRADYHLFWSGYVPMKMSDTICVEERLPQGAAGVLINQTHTYRDLYLPIDSAERLWFDAIDGNSSIGDIVEERLPSPCSESRLDMVRSFFERLWWYDQVVFDTSRHQG